MLKITCCVQKLFTPFKYSQRPQLSRLATFAVGAKWIYFFQQIASPAVCWRTVFVNCCKLTLFLLFLGNQ